MFLRTIFHRVCNTLAVASLILGLSFAVTRAHAQEPKTKIRIANSAMSVTSLPLLAAREWKLFAERGLEVEIILMSPAITVPAMVSGEIDYFAGVGPGAASASLSGLPLRAVWVSSDKVSYSLMANPKFETLQELKGKPDEVKRVIRAMQLAKDAMRKSKDKSVELMIRVLKMDQESAAGTYDIFLKTLSPDGVPTRAGIENLIKSIQAQGRFVDKKPSFTDVADDRLAKEVARELGYKIH